MTTKLQCPICDSLNVQGPNKLDICLCLACHHSDCFVAFVVDLPGYLAFGKALEEFKLAVMQEMLIPLCTPILDFLAELLGDVHKCNCGGHWK